MYVYHISTSYIYICICRFLKAVLFNNPCEENPFYLKVKSAPHKTGTHYYEINKNALAEIVLIAQKYSMLRKATPSQKIYIQNKCGAGINTSSVGKGGKIPPPPKPKKLL